MIALDTNVVVRLLTNDDPAQVARARSLLERETVWVGLAVLMECEWVLRAVYRLGRPAIHRALLRFTRLPQVIVEDDSACSLILDLYGAGFDFADALHLAAAGPHVSAMATFDATLVRRASHRGVRPPVVAP